MREDKLQDIGQVSATSVNRTHMVTLHSGEHRSGDLPTLYSGFTITNDYNNVFSWSPTTNVVVLNDFCSYQIGLRNVTS